MPDETKNQNLQTENDLFLDCGVCGDKCSICDLIILCPECRNRMKRILYGAVKQDKSYKEVEEIIG